jgi:hypothetical protein
MRTKAGRSLTHEELARGAEGLLRVQELAREYIHMQMVEGNRAKLTKKLNNVWAEILQINDAGVE